MPELPEVQTTVNDLNKKIVGRKITGAWFDWGKTIKSPLREFEKNIKGKKILKVERLAKNILIYLSGDFILLVHQKMTGHLLVGKWKIEGKKVIPIEPKHIISDPQNRFVHLILFLDNGQMLALSDLRKFAKVILGTKNYMENLPELKELGPDALEIRFEDFKNIVGQKHGKIKQILMDQTAISGIGNIYSDEMLWVAKIHPFKPANKLSEKELKNLYSAMKKVLEKALKLRGTSVSDYRDIEGREGKYADVRYVYQREDEKCQRCGTMIKRVKMGGRSAHYCPKCQKL
ncbi:MAG: DNA-formamidopyrimidine glycosylase [Candidatus Pacebacteria bacterium]|nr:DNA-formamidopyrimidine glycosylase [Candidatus Paceibacterota bacterium]